MDGTLLSPSVPTSPETPAPIPTMWGHKSTLVVPKSCCLTLLPQDPKLRVQDWNTPHHAAPNWYGPLLGWPPGPGGPVGVELSLGSVRNGSACAWPGLGLLAAPPPPASRSWWPSHSM